MGKSYKRNDYHPKKGDRRSVRKQDKQDKQDKQKFKKWVEWNYPHDDLRP
jgi:hypothetical protein